MNWVRGISTAVLVTAGVALVGCSGGAVAPTTVTLSPPIYSPSPSTSASLGDSGSSESSTSSSSSESPSSSESSTPPSSPVDNPSQYVGSWIETWDNGSDPGVQYHDQYRVADSGGVLTITCSTHTYTFSTPDTSSGMLEFHQSNASGDTTVYYALYRDGANLSGAAVSTVAGANQSFPILWKPVVGIL